MRAAFAFGTRTTNADPESRNDSGWADRLRPLDILRLRNMSLGPGAVYRIRRGSSGGPIIERSFQSQFGLGLPFGLKLCVA